jgi:hypothetical protein
MIDAMPENRLVLGPKIVSSLYRDQRIVVFG